MKNLRSNAESKVILEIRQGEEPFTENDVQGILEIPNINRINRLWSEQIEIPQLAPVTGDEQSDRLFTFHFQNRLAGNAPVLLADEPTGNLDEDTANEIIAIFSELAHEKNKCVIKVTHSKELARKADVILTLKKGAIVETEDTVPV